MTKKPRWQDRRELKKTVDCQSRPHTGSPFEEEKTYFDDNLGEVDLDEHRTGLTGRDGDGEVYLDCRENLVAKSSTYHLCQSGDW